MLALTPSNPTGAYQLSLDAPDEFTIADSMMKVDQWERQLLAKAPRRYGKSKFMLSQHGNDSNFRNEAINGWFFEMGTSFQLPQQGMLVFDFASTRRPPRNAVPISDVHIGGIMRAILKSNAVIPDLKGVLTCIAPQMYVTCLQLRKILQLIQNFPDLMLDIICMLGWEHQAGLSADRTGFRPVSDQCHRVMMSLCHVARRIICGVQMSYVSRQICGVQCRICGVSQSALRSPCHSVNSLDRNS